MVCILLVGLLLYNPFLGLFHDSNGLSLCPPASYRGTVGAGELQGFSPVTNSFAVDILAAAYIGEIVPVLQEKKFHLAIDATPSAVILRDFSSNLWFRPPPSA